jgi:hypothetical protein
MGGRDHPGRPSPPRVIVSGLVGVYPVGGVAFDYLQYVLGLARLGCEVVYHEDTWCWPYHPLENQNVESGDYSAAFIGAFFARYAPELAGRWHYLHLHSQSYGMTRAAFAEFARTADLFLNVSGAGMIPEELNPSAIKVFLDTDPGYNQIMLAERFAWSENVERWCASVAAHDRHFTYAENIGAPDCRVPAAGYAWEPTRMPIVLDLWRAARERDPAPGAPWTTVMTWNTWKGALVHRGVEYRGKDAGFAPLLDLPRRTHVPLVVAVGGTAAPLDRLRAGGWQVVDAPVISRTPEQYQDFIAGSRGELSPAKHVYVALRTGWFSCRSACYLAAGRPVVVEDTGFAPDLPVGRGLLAFRTPDEALAAIAAGEGDYSRQRAAAFDVAREHFAADRVLPQFLAAIQAARVPGAGAAPGGGR